jgi:5-methylcytosine-specific restriction endonuclease McrA
MTREIPEWIGAHDDQAIPARVKVRVFWKHDGWCAKCGRTLPVGKWACDHIVALANGGQHRESNLQPLCVSPCHSNKTKADVAQKSKDYRVRAKHAGIKKPRTIRSWRKFNGEIVHAERER